MSALHSALTALGPRDFADVPVNDLSSFLKSTFEAADTIADSVPYPPEPSNTSLETQPTANFATGAADIVPSAARSPLPTKIDADTLAEFNGKWGRPVKVSPKDNPASVTVWKMAGNDRRGAWFARRSVHEGLGFKKWKKAMEWEFQESLAVEGKPGEGSIRGIGADKRLEHLESKGEGALEVYQLAAQFPKPTAPREFITMLLTTDANYKTSADSARQFAMVSIPVNHQDAPPRDGLVRGQYESIEMIREIKRTPTKSASSTNLHTPSQTTEASEHSPSRDRGHTISYAESRGPEAKGEKVDHQDEDDEAELNPVEWIMITRSDPGGGIPRFMVERNTPASITADAAKFLNWACARDDFPVKNATSAAAADNTGSEPPQAETAQAETAHVEPARAEAAVPEKVRRTSTSGSLNPAFTNGHLAGMDRKVVEEASQVGLIESLRNTVGNGLANYTPTIVQNNLPAFISGNRNEEYDDTDSSDTSSLTSFASAEQFTTAPDGSSEQSSLPPSDQPSTNPLASQSSLSLQSPESQSLISPTPSEIGLTKASTGHNEKELAKLSKKREQLDAKLARAREKDEKEKAKAQSKYERDMAKLEAKREKEIRKINARKKKAAERDSVSSLQRERDQWRAHAEVIRRENELLKEQVGELQRENTVLVQRLGKSEEGKGMLRGVKEELKKRERGVSVGSTGSGRSGRSGSLRKTEVPA